jgi:hypothetical protein
VQENAAELYCTVLRLSTYCRSRRVLCCSCSSQHNFAAIETIRLALAVTQFVLACLHEHLGELQHVDLVQGRLMVFLFLPRQSLVLGVQGAPRAPLPKLNAHHIMWLGPAAKHVAWEAPVIGQRLLHAEVKSSQASKAYQNLFNDRPQGAVVNKVKALFKQSIPYAGVLRHETSVSGWLSLVRHSSKQLASRNMFEDILGQKIFMKLRIVGTDAAYTSTRVWGHAMIAKRLPPLQCKVQGSLQKLKQQVPILR